MLPSTVLQRNREKYLSHIKAERDVVAALRRMLDAGPTPERRAYVLDSLDSKYDGAQSLATQVLSVWGGRESIDTLHQRLVALLARTDAVSLRGVTIDALVRCVEAADTSWVLNMYFSRPTINSKHELLYLARAVDPESARTRLVAELRGSDPLNRHAAAKVIAVMPYADCRDLVGSLLDDSDDYNRQAAILILNLLANGQTDTPDSDGAAKR